MVVNSRVRNNVGSYPNFTGRGASSYGHINYCWHNYLPFKGVGEGKAAIAILNIVGTVISLFTGCVGREENSYGHVKYCWYNYLLFYRVGKAAIARSNIVVTVRSLNIHISSSFQYPSMSKRGKGTAWRLGC